MDITAVLSANMQGYHMSLGEAGIVAVISIGIVMAILVIISGILNIFNVVYELNKQKEDEKAKLDAIKAEEERKKAEEERIEAQKLAEDETLKVEEITQDTISDTQLIAVITAAIAASLNTSTDKLVVRSIRKSGSWKDTALKENINRIQYR